MYLNIHNVFAKDPRIKALQELIKIQENRRIHLKGLCGSFPAVLLGQLSNFTKSPLLIIANDEEEAGYLYQDICQIHGEDKTMYLPSPYKKGHEFKDSDAAFEILRAEVLSRISQKEEHLKIVTYPEAMIPKVVSGQEIRLKTIFLQLHEEISPQYIVEHLLSFGFERQDYVYQPGQFSLRGSLLDVFSYTNELPYRIDFFGNTIDSLRTFNPADQLSVERKKEITILPSLENKQESGVYIWQTLPDSTIVCLQDGNWIGSRIKYLTEQYHLDQPEEYIPNRFVQIEWGAKCSKSPDAAIAFSCSLQPSFKKNFELLSDTLHQYEEEGYRLYLLSAQSKQSERLLEIFKDRQDIFLLTAINQTLHEGFVDHDQKKVCFTEHQIFDRYHKYHLKNESVKTGKAAISLKELTNFQIGDYIVHIDHGVGKFAGLVNTDINGKTQEMIRLTYKNEDTIFVSLHSLHKLSKYKGKEGDPPALNKLGTGAWEKMKERTKSKIKDIARDLIRLYSQRRDEKGFAYSADSYLQQKLEASFFFEDTPDQSKATIDVKKDMESARPMDRLICGDVGFGKTEVAIRAAFKAATDGKQVAVLVPTTVLALQHYKNFKERLKDFPVEVEYISRAKTNGQIKPILQSLHEKGKPEIIIGTHRLVSKDVKFKDLGLLIIDEEQKFGVSVKEKLRQLKANVDTLTLTATPIPRTLQFSLMGARDISVIQTPPPNRYPIQTELHIFDEQLIKEAIEQELSRNGQLYFVNNRIQNIYQMETLLHQLVPQARICVGHGQMEPLHLEEIILDFIDYKYDILIATTIIESGIDIPNVNTIIINNAQNFGLSDLHQLRGRVGRTNKKAYCYLFSPPIETLTTEARRRLQAIENFSDLGSGIHIAMQDLDIRGAGNLLGSEQSGFIADVGYETYQKILSEAIEELKTEEFSDLYGQNKELPKSPVACGWYVKETLIESDLDLKFPSSYVRGDAERIMLYRELDSITDIEMIPSFESRLIDRFGEIPDPAKELIRIVELRQLGSRLGIEKIMLKNGEMFIYFLSDTESPYFQSSQFGAIILFVQNKHRMCRFREIKGKRSIVIQNVHRVETAIGHLHEMVSNLGQDTAL